MVVLWVVLCDMAFVRVVCCEKFVFVCCDACVGLCLAVLCFVVLCYVMCVVL